MQRAQEGHSQTPHLLLALRSRLMGPRREGQTDSSDAVVIAHLQYFYLILVDSFFVLEVGWGLKHSVLKFCVIFLKKHNQMYIQLTFNNTGIRGPDAVENLHTALQ